VVKGHLQSHQIAFAEVDVSVDTEKAREMVTKSGQYGEIVVGFDRTRINALLGIA
jgi:hypothetical protein